MNRILVVNAGSTSLKLSIVEGDDASAVSSFDEAGRIDAVAHRVVHGGARFFDAVAIDDGLLKALEEVAELAPLHNNAALSAIREARTALPDTPHVAVFDTGFHRTIPDEASTYALPARWREEWGIRRFGFHGLSVQWASEQVQAARLVVCHLGGGCSVTAVLDGRSVDTTMGYSPLEGVPMATRSGSIDAEIVLHLLRTKTLDLDGIEHALELESGLLGLSGETDRVERLEQSGTREAELALRVFAHRVAGAVAAMTVSLGGLDALVFTAGIGAGSARVRADVCARLPHIGVELDHAANAAAIPDEDVGAAGTAVRVVVLEAREDIVAARAAAALLSSSS